MLIFAMNNIATNKLHIPPNEFNKFLRGANETRRKINKYCNDSFVNIYATHALFQCIQSKVIIKY